jgi:hypothetical protein
MKIYSDEDPYYKLDLESEDGPGVPQKAYWEKAREMDGFFNISMSSLFVFLP